MIRSFGFAAVTAAMLSACGPDASDSSGAGDQSGDAAAMPPQPPEPPAVEDIVALLVERFDVEACADATPLGQIARRGPDSNQTVRSYAAQPDCIAAMRVAFDAIGFEQDASGGYSYSGSRDLIETVSFTPSQTGQTTGIEWELFGQ